MYSTKTVSSQTTSPWIPLDDNQAAFNATVAVEVSGTLTYTVEFTLDNIQDPAVTPVAFPIGLVGETTSNTTFIRSPVKAIRLNVTAFTSGSATIGARQGTDNVWGYPDSTDFADDFATSAKTLWASGQIFFIPPGDGGSNGMLFAGGGTGAFTLSAAVPAGFVVPELWIYLTADAGGSGNPAGWHYATMSSDTAGTVHADRYDSTSGVIPVFPASPATLNCTSATRLTTTVSEIQIFEVPVNFATQMGLNGLMEMTFKTFGNNAASSKFLSLRAGTNLLYQSIPTTNPVLDWGVAVSACGSLSRQLLTRQSSSQYAAAVATISNDFRSVDLAAETILNVSIKLTATTDSFAVAVRKLSMIYGD
jgi:hypothetical protein